MIELQKLVKDYEEFKSLERQDVPEGLSEKISLLEGKRLSGSKTRSILALLIVHALSALAVLAICPQYHIHLIENFMGLMVIFDRFGPLVCGFLCGSLLLSTSIALSALLLPRTARFYLFSIKYYHVAGVTVLSLLGFALIGSVTINVYLMGWVVGAIAVGLVTMPLMVAGEVQALKAE